jgi:hypothetical protein
VFEVKCIQNNNNDPCLHECSPDVINCYNICQESNYDIVTGDYDEKEIKICEKICNKSYNICEKNCRDDLKNDICLINCSDNLKNNIRECLGDENCI